MTDRDIQKEWQRFGRHGERPLNAAELRHVRLYTVGSYIGYVVLIGGALAGWISLGLWVWATTWAVLR